MSPFSHLPNPLGFGAYYTINSAKIKGFLAVILALQVAKYTSYSGAIFIMFFQYFWNCRRPVLVILYDVWGILPRNFFITAINLFSSSLFICVARFPFVNPNVVSRNLKSASLAELRIFKIANRTGSWITLLIPLWNCFRSLSINRPHSFYLPQNPAIVYMSDYHWD